jgi:tetratricopeptide (TPR) repeat protein
MAADAWEEQRWADAANCYRALCRRFPDDALFHFRLAYSLHADGQFRRAIPAHQDAAEFDEYRGVSLYNLGCAHAALGNTDRAFEALHEALDAGFDDRDQMVRDEDLYPLHDDPRWAELVEGRVTPPPPPAHGGPIDPPVVDEAAFLLGEWEVLDDRGRRIGSMSIHPAHDGRAIVREWRGNDHSTGTALLFYDEFVEAWRQIAIDSDGNVIEMIGDVHRREFEFEGELHTGRGDRILQRSTISQRRDGNLDLETEESEDDGQSWRRVWTATYRHLGIVPPGHPEPWPEAQPDPGHGGRPGGGWKPWFSPRK